MRWKISINYYIMLLPGVIVLLLFSIYPMLGIVMAFEDYNPSKGFFGSQWIGLDNFRYMFEIPDSMLVFRNTLQLAISKIVANLAVSLFFALLFHELRFHVFKRVIQTIVYLPHFISWVLLGGILAQMFAYEGIVNQIAGLFGFEPTLFLGSNQWFPLILVGSDVWKEFGFSAIVFIAALTGINPALYESAAIDGAGRWQRLRYITIPGIATTVVLIATLALQNVLNAGFEQIFNLYNPVVYKSSDIIDTYVYRVGLLESQFELATAVGLMKSIVSFVLIVLSYRLAAKFANYRIF